MGIKKIWKDLGGGETIAVADFVTEHFKRTGNIPLVAVDEATLRYHGLTEAQEKAIRQSQVEKGHFKKEKVLFYRIQNLLALGVRLLFVFDGPHRPEYKRHKKTGRVPDEATQLWKDLLHNLKLPCHTAPGEAEAECARLQSLGLVDAVYTEDSDAFAFGCSVLIRGNPSPNEKTKRLNVRIYRLEKIQHQLQGFDQDGFILFAILSGGDYTDGLRNLGPKLALEAVAKGLGKFLCDPKYHKPLFQAHLRRFLSLQGSMIQVPKDFPPDNVRAAHVSPRVSSQAELQLLVNKLDKRSLLDLNAIKWDELALFMGQNFNIWTDGFMRNIGPILLVNKLNESTPDENSLQDIGVELIKQRKVDAGINDVKGRFQPARLCPVHLNQTKTGTPWSPAGKTEFQIPGCILEHALPCLFERPTRILSKNVRKRKSEENSNSIEPPRKKLASKQGEPSAAVPVLTSGLGPAGFIIPPFAELDYDACPLSPTTEDDDGIRQAIALSLCDQGVAVGQQLTGILEEVANRSPIEWMRAGVFNERAFHSTDVGVIDLTGD